MSWLHVHCSTLWPEARYGGMAYSPDVFPFDVLYPDNRPSSAVDGLVVVDLAVHRKVYCGSWGITYDAFCTIGNLDHDAAERRLQVLGVPEVERR